MSPPKGRGTFFCIAPLLTHLTYHIWAANAGGYTVWVTPHDSYSSSVGVLGCKVNTNRIAYWPTSVDCSALCVRLSLGDRAVNLLKVDQSGGAYDVSYDAWNYLQTGESAADVPIAGGAVAMKYEDVNVTECAVLIKTKDGKLPLSAANSMNFLASCLDQKGGSWVGDHYALYNILDPICTWGYDEVCNLGWPAANQASCPHTLGTTVALTTEPVYNIQYPSGKMVLAGNSSMVIDTLGDASRSWSLHQSAWLEHNLLGVGSFLVLVHMIHKMVA